MSMNTNKKHKLKKEAEDKLREYLNEYEEDIKNSENTVRIQHICSTNTEGLVQIKLGYKYVVVS